MSDLNDYYDKVYYDPNERLETLKGWLQFPGKENLIIDGIYQDKGERQPPIFDHINPLNIIKRIFKRFFLAITPLNFNYQFVFIGSMTKNKCFNKSESL